MRAGGERRLGGRDKPGLVVGGRTLLGAVVAAGAAAGAREVIVVGPERAGLDGVLFVAEEPLGAGPVPALRRGLAEAAPPWLAVLAADLPFLRAVLNLWKDADPNIPVLKEAKAEYAKL